MSPLVRSPTKICRGGQDDTSDQQATSQPTTTTHIHFSITLSSAASFKFFRHFFLSLQSQLTVRYRPISPTYTRTTRAARQLGLREYKDLDIWAADVRLWLCMCTYLFHRCLLPDFSLQTPEPKDGNLYNPLYFGGKTGRVLVDNKIHWASNKVYKWKRDASKPV